MRAVCPARTEASSCSLPAPCKVWPALDPETGAALALFKDGDPTARGGWVTCPRDSNPAALTLTFLLRCLCGHKLAALPQRADHLVRKEHASLTSSDNGPSAQGGLQREDRKARKVLGGGGRCRRTGKSREAARQAGGLSSGACSTRDPEAQGGDCPGRTRDPSHGLFYLLPSLRARSSHPLPRRPQRPRLGRGQSQEHQECDADVPGDPGAMTTAPAGSWSQGQPDSDSGARAS